MQSLRDSPPPVIATAGWSIPKAVAGRFPGGNSALERYAAVFNGVEINSTFYKRHRPSTFARWASVVPDHFRFAVKLPKQITHVRRLQDIEEDLALFFDDISHLGGAIGPLLCQLPPSLDFDSHAISRGLALIREKHQGRIAIEPRHQSWTSPAALELLERLMIDPVLADPPVIWSVADFRAPARYVRLHGQPKLYYSRYGRDALIVFRDLLASGGWCVFDNTASGAAAENALEMLALDT